MATKDYELFFTEPDAVESMNCKVCGTRCEVERSRLDATGFAEGMAKRGHWHDRFQCPHSGEPWHEQALELAVAIDETPSKRIAELMRLDLDDILKANGCLPG